MANIKSNWRSFSAPITAASSWVEMKGWIQDIEEGLPERAVYVIRTLRPFSISYQNRASPVMYIGEGKFEQRFRHHMKWITEIGDDLPILSFEVRYQAVRVRNNMVAHREVEADLLYEFGMIYGSTPLLNKQYEYKFRSHSYEKGFFNVLHPGKGRGFKWALLPLKSNLNYESFIKGQFGG